MALHEESIVIDASTVGFIEYVGEDLMLDDLLKGGVTASNATVCMQHNLSEAMGELARYHDWAEKKKDMTLIVKTSEDIVKAKKEGKTALIPHIENGGVIGNAEFLLHDMEDADDETLSKVQIIVSESKRIARITRSLRAVDQPVVEDYLPGGRKMLRIDPDPEAESSPVQRL